MFYLLALYSTPLFYRVCSLCVKLFYSDGSYGYLIPFWDPLAITNRLQLQPAIVPEKSEPSLNGPGCFLCAVGLFCGCLLFLKPKQVMTSVRQTSPGHMLLAFRQRLFGVHFSAGQSFPAATPAGTLLWVGPRLCHTRSRPTENIPAHYMGLS